MTGGCLPIDHLHPVLMAILVPLRSVSRLDAPGGDFWEPEAVRGCYDAIKNNLVGMAGFDLIGI